MCLDVFTIPFLLKVQTKTGQIRDPLEWLTLFHTSSQEDVVLEDRRVVAKLRPGQRGVDEMVVLIRGPIVLCRNKESEEKKT